MFKPGQIALVKFRYSDDSGENLRPVLILTRIAVTSSSLLIGSIGEISSTRLNNVCKELADWLLTINE